jgi:hypothetical protein
VQHHTANSVVAYMRATNAPAQPGHEAASLGLFLLLLLLL